MDERVRALFSKAVRTDAGAAWGSRSVEGRPSGFELRASLSLVYIVHTAIARPLIAFIYFRNRLQFFYEFFETKSDGGKQWYRCYGLEVSHRAPSGSIFHPNILLHKGFIEG